MGKRTRTYDRAALKAAFDNAGTLRRTKPSTRDVAALGMDGEAVVRMIQALRYPGDFDKSATAITTRRTGTTATSRWWMNDALDAIVRRVYPAAAGEVR